MGKPEKTFIYLTTSDTFTDIADPSAAGPSDGMMWYRTDTKQFKQRVDGLVKVLADSTGVSTTAIPVQVTRSAGVNDGTENITSVGFKPSHIILLAKSDADAAFWSEGKAVGNNNLMTVSHGGNPIMDFTKCLDISNVNDGYSATVGAFLDNGFSLVWTKKGAGLAITVKCLVFK